MSDSFIPKTGYPPVYWGIHINQSLLANFDSISFIFYSSCVKGLKLYSNENVLKVTANDLYRARQYPAIAVQERVNKK